MARPFRIGATGAWVVLATRTNQASVDDVLQRHGTPSQTEPSSTPEAIKDLQSSGGPSENQCTGALLDAIRPHPKAGPTRCDCSIYTVGGVQVTFRWPQPLEWPLAEVTPPGLAVMLIVEPSEALPLKETVSPKYCCWLPVGL
jgi:hypothetical protein